MCALFLVVFTCFILIVSSSLATEKTQCEAVAAKAALENQNTIVNTTYSNLIGTWLSENCEIRPGPQYVLRSYTFRADGTYKVIQHHYWDGSCSSPKFTMVSQGAIRLKRGSLLNADAATGYIRPTNISVIPQDTKAAKELERLVARECPEHNWKSWRRYEEHLVFEASGNHRQQHGNTFPNIFTFQQDERQPERRNEAVVESACTGELKWAFNELKLLKVQTRPVFGEGLKSTARLELLVGDVHSRREMRERYVPTGFQTPLLKYLREEAVYAVINSRNYTVVNRCSICGSLVAGDKTPPHLLEKPHLPPYIWGEWTSTRCEIRPMGLYLTRKFTFYSESSEWIGEHRFYQDPFCTTQKFTVTAAGHYFFTSPSEILQHTTNIDFKIEKATLTPATKRTAYEMRAYNSCGRKHWQAGIPQELTTTNGCLQLGIIIPSIQHEVVKIEMDYRGECLLYLGQPDSDNLPRINSERPTAFQVPLMKCGHTERYSQTLDEILDYPDQYNHAKSLSSSALLSLTATVMFVLFAVV